MFFAALTPLLPHYVHELPPRQSRRRRVAGHVPRRCPGGGNSRRDGRRAPRREAHRADRALAARADDGRLRAGGFRVDAGPGALPAGNLERVLVDRRPELARRCRAGRAARPADRVRVRRRDRGSALRARARSGRVLHRNGPAFGAVAGLALVLAGAAARGTCRRPSAPALRMLFAAFGATDDPDRRLALPPSRSLLRDAVGPRPLAPLGPRLGRSRSRRDLPRLGGVRSRVGAGARTALRPARPPAAPSRRAGRLGRGRAAAALAAPRACCWRS